METRDGDEGEASRPQDHHLAGMSVCRTFTMRVLCAGSPDSQITWKTGRSYDAALMYPPEMDGATASPRVRPFLGNGDIYTLNLKCGGALFEILRVLAFRSQDRLEKEDSFLFHK